MCGISLCRLVGSDMGFQLQTFGSDPEDPDEFVYFGNLTKDWKRVLLYSEGGRESRRKVEDMLPRMIRGVLGLPGGLVPYSRKKSSGRRHVCVRLDNWYEEGCPFRRDFVEACREVAKGVDVGTMPLWFQDALEVELPDDFKEDDY